jgi:very-short-patch-repair endonuclease
MNEHNNRRTDRARKLRSTQTASESLMWAVLRAGQLNGLKFRRQYPIGPFYADFACVREKLLIEIDGGYHDHTEQADIDRQQWLEDNGWRVLRFTDQTVMTDVEPLLLAICQAVGVSPDFKKRSKGEAGTDSRFRGQS